MLVYLYLTFAFVLFLSCFKEVKNIEKIRFGLICILGIIALNFLPSVLNQSYIEFKIFNPFVLADTMEFFWFKIDELNLYFALFAIVYSLTFTKISAMRTGQLCLLLFGVLIFNIKYLFVFLFLSELIFYSYLRLKRKINYIYTFSVLFTSCSIFFFFQNYFWMNKIIYIDELSNSLVTSSLYSFFVLLFFLKIIAKYYILNRSLTSNSTFFNLLDIYIFCRVIELITPSDLYFLEVLLSLLFIVTLLSLLKNSSYRFRGEQIELLIFLVASFSLINSRIDFFVFMITMFSVLKRIKEQVLRFCLDHVNLREYIFYIYGYLVSPLSPLGICFVIFGLYFFNISIVSFILYSVTILCLLTANCWYIDNGKLDRSMLRFTPIILFIFSLLVIPLITLDTSVLENSILRLLALSNDIPYEALSYSNTQIIVFSLIIFFLYCILFFLARRGYVWKILNKLEQVLFRFSRDNRFPIKFSSNKKIILNTNRSLAGLQRTLDITESSVLLIVVIVMTIFIFSLLR